MPRRGLAPAPALALTLALALALVVAPAPARAAAEGSLPVNEFNRSESALPGDAPEDVFAVGDDVLLQITRTRNIQPFPSSASGAAAMPSSWDDAQPFNISDLDDFFHAFDPYRLGTVLSVPQNVSSACNATVHQYVAGLKSTEKWAVKMWDSTGRHNTGFFWGNTYWTGSKMQCDYIVEGEAPFSTAFSVLKIVAHLPQHLSATESIVHLGVCLPYDCNDHDIKTLAELVMNNGTLKFGELLNIRSPHNPYIFWKDPVFWILLGVSVFVCSMLALGTAYDFYLIHRKEDFTRRSAFEFSTASTNGKINQQNGRITTIQTLDQLCNNNIVKNPHVDSTPSKAEKQCPLMKSFHIDFSRLLQGMLLSFSIRINLKTICDRGVGSDTIPIIHGLRFLSMIWVVLGHSCIVAFKYSDNMTYREVMENNFIFQTITNAPYSVDTFFFISGLLVSFLYFRTVKKVDINSVTQSTGFKSGMMQFLGFLGYRYLRLTVPYMFVLGGVQVCMKWFQHNSVFEPPTLDHVNCPEYWWRNALYINTLFPVQDMCMLWSWYLADDTQFYVLGSILLILATSHFRFAVAITATFLASSWCTTAFVAFSNKHMPSLDDPFALFDKIYDKPWTRLGPYLIGMCVGWYLCKKNCTIRMNKIMAATGWVVSTCLLFYLVFGLYKQELHPIVAAIYSSLSHSLWALGLSWIVIACCTGYGGYINKLLSMSILYPFSRVTYCAYLVHPMVIRVIPMTSDAPLHLTKETVAMLFLGELVASYIVAFVVSLAFEAPMVALLKVINPIRKDEPKKNDTK